MDRQWHIRQQLELLSSPTSILYHRIDTYSSVVEGVRRVRRILASPMTRRDEYTENDRLIRACTRNDVEAARWLLDRTNLRPINMKQGINRSALHEAVLHHHSQALVRLLCQHGADPQQRDSLGRTPVHYAASCGHLNVLIDLMQYTRASVSTLVDIEGRCPLMYACGEGHLAMCQWLVEHQGADCHRLDDRGRSCLIYACRVGHAELVKWLLTVLSPRPSNTGWHPLHYACSNGHSSIVRLLLQDHPQGGHVVTESGHSALFMAMHSPQHAVDMVTCLLDSHRSVQLTPQDIEDVTCDKSLILLLAQRRHALDYLPDLLERTDYFLPLVHLLLLSEHVHCFKHLLSLPRHQPLVQHYLRHPLTLKQTARCRLRQCIATSNAIDLLELNSALKKFLRFESLN